MGVDIKLEGSIYRDGLPRFGQTYTIANELWKVCPVAGDTLLRSETYGVGYDDPRLKTALDEVNLYLQNYVPEEGKDLSSSMLISTEEAFFGTEKGGKLFEGLVPKDEIPIKDAAY
jgi:hypothetical protein